MSEIWFDGEFFDEDDPRARVALKAHGLHYGGGVFEGDRSYETDRGPAVFRLDDHVSRLLRSADSIDLRCRFSPEEIRDATIETVRRSGMRNAYVRTLMFYGDGCNLRLDPFPVAAGGAGAETHLMIATLPWPQYSGDGGQRLGIADYLRLDERSFNVRSKVSGRYVSLMMAQRRAKHAGFGDALMLDAHGYVAEASVSNIFFTRDGDLITPQLGHILPGITRDTVMTLAKDAGLYVHERQMLPLFDGLDESFITGTAVEIAWVRSIEGHVFGPNCGQTTKTLQQLYDRVIHGKEPKYEHWLTYVE